MAKPTRPMPVLALGSSTRKPGTMPHRPVTNKGGPPSPPPQATRKPVAIPPPPVDARNPRPSMQPLTTKKPRPKLRVTRAKDGSYQIESDVTGQWAPAISGLDKQYAETMVARAQNRPVKH